MPDIKVSFSGLAAGADSIQASQRSISAELDDLKSRLQPLVSTWTGSAADNYNFQQGQWDSSAEDLNSVLDRIAAALRTASEDYADGERNNANRFAG